MMEQDRDSVKVAQNFKHFYNKLLHELIDNNIIVDNMHKNLGIKTLLGGVLYTAWDIMGLSKMENEGPSVRKAYDFLKFMSDTCEEGKEYSFYWGQFEEYLRKNGFNLR